jgi:hypothetical protein
MDKLNLVLPVKESPLRGQLSEDELLIFLFRLANQETNMVTMTAASSLRYRMLQWVRTGEWLNEYSSQHDITFKAASNIGDLTQKY